MTPLLKQIKEILSSEANKLSNGSSIYTTDAYSLISRDDESGLEQITLSMTRFLETDEDHDKEIEIYNQILAFDPNTLFEDDEIMDKFTRIEITEESLSGTRPKIWVTPYNDTFMIYGTDGTILIQYITSGQY